MGITVLWYLTECWIICKCSIGTRTVVGILSCAIDKVVAGVKAYFPRKCYDHPTTYSLGCRGLLPWGVGIKEVGCEADHSHPFSAKVKND